MSNSFLKAETVVDSIPNGTLNRLVLTAKVDASNWNIRWKTKEGVGHYLNVKRPSPAEIDDVHGAAYQLLIQSDDGTVIASDVIMATDKFPVPVRMVTSRDGRSEFSTTGDRNLFNGVSIDGPDSGTEIEITTDRKGSVTYHSINVDVLPDPDAFDETIKTEDLAGHGGRWRFLDEVSPRSGGIVVGGRYELELIAESETGGYIAVCHGGAKIDSERWPNGSIKARLVPTDFDNHYNVEWIGVDGRRVDDEVSATFEGDNLMTFEFPLLETTLRFSRSLAKHVEK